MTCRMEDFYAKAGAAGIFLVEYAGMPAAAGDMRDLRYIAEKEGSDIQTVLIDMVDNSMGAVFDLCILGDVEGEDRMANCQSAWDKFVVERDKGRFPRFVALRAELGLSVTDAKRLGTF